MRIVVGNEELRMLLPGLLPHGTQMIKNSGEDPTTFSLRVSEDYAHFECTEGPETIIRSDNLSEVCEALKQALMIHVANYAAGCVFVHAGVVGYRGAAMLLPGASFAGKSTLTAALVRHGATYYSDEYAILDDEGCIHPYARDLSMRKPGETQQESIPASAFGGVSGNDRLPVRFIVFTQFQSEGVWLPKPVSRGMAALEMMKHTIAVQRTPSRVMATLATALERANAFTSPRGDANELAPILLEWLESAVSQGLLPANARGHQ